MATSRPVRIARPRPSPPPADRSTVVRRYAVRPVVRSARPVLAQRGNRGGTQRALRVAIVYLAALVVIYAGFILYDRTAPGGTSSPASNGLVTFTGVFVVLAVGGALFALTPAPRAVEVAADHVIVIGRWGRRRRLPPLEELSLRVVRRYSQGWLSPLPVELVELWGEDVPVRSYLADAELFEGTASTQPAPGP